MLGWGLIGYIEVTVMTEIQPSYLLLICVFAGVLAFFSLRYDPQRLHGKVLRCMVTGFGLLLCWNLVSSIRLGVNPLSMLAAGSLGLPGLGMLSVFALLP